MIDELGRADWAVRAATDTPAWSLSDAELVAALDAVHALEQCLATVKLTLVREFDGRGIAVPHGASSTAVWLRERWRLPIGRARRLVADAAALGATAPTLRAALTAGVVTLDQARVITEAVEAIPAEAGAEAADKALDMLIEWAGQFESTLLRKLGSRILDHVAPEIADAVARAALDSEEARAARDRHLTLSDLHDGRFRLAGTLDAETAASLTSALAPLTTPAGSDDSRTPGQRRHDALGDLCRLALRSEELPEHGGDAAQIVVTTSYDAVSRQLGVGSLDTGTALTPATVRRLACDAAVLPAVLGGNGQILDLGRQRRLITGPLRRALVLRDNGCAFPGCDRPPRWCDGHHVVLGRRRGDRTAQFRPASAATITGRCTTATGASGSPPTGGPSSCRPPGWTRRACPVATPTTGGHEPLASGLTRNALGRPQSATRWAGNARSPATDGRPALRCSADPAQRSVTRMPACAL